MLEATKNVDGGAGVLHIVKNYTGDVMNFEMAAELAEAEGITVESVVVDDDVAVQDSTYTAGRRGVGATVLVEKIAGAAADQGRGLKDVADVARRVNAASRSMGVALTSCTVPAVGHPTFDLSDTEIEVGIGIHGEPGRQRMAMQPARAVAELMLDPVLNDLDFTDLIRFGRRGAVREQHGRHTADRAICHVLGIRGHPRQGRSEDRPLPGGPVHHQPGHGRLFGHAAARRRRAAAAMGPSGQHACASEGMLNG